MPWDLSDTDVVVNGGTSGYKPRNGEALSDLVKRVVEAESLGTVDVRADGSEVDQGSPAARETASEFDRIEIERHARVGM